MASRPTKNSVRLRQTLSRVLLTRLVEDHECNPGGFWPSEDPFHWYGPILVRYPGVVFAYAAIEMVAIAAGEMKDSDKEVPKAINAGDLPDRRLLLRLDPPHRLHASDERVHMPKSFTRVVEVRVRHAGEVRGRVHRVDASRPLPINHGDRLPARFNRYAVVSPVIPAPMTRRPPRDCARGLKRGKVAESFQYELQSSSAISLNPLPISDPRALSA